MKRAFPAATGMAKAVETRPGVPLVLASLARDHGAMFRTSVVGREDVNAILAVLFDIRRELVRIRETLGVDDDGDETEED